MVGFCEAGRHGFLWRIDYTRPGRGCGRQISAVLRCKSRDVEANVVDGVSTESGSDRVFPDVQTRTRPLPLPVLTSQHRTGCHCEVFVTEISIRERRLLTTASPRLLLRQSADLKEPGRFRCERSRAAVIAAAVLRFDPRTDLCE